MAAQVVQINDGEPKTWCLYAETNPSERDGVTLYIDKWKEVAPSGEPHIRLAIIRAKSKDAAVTWLLQNPPSLLPLFHWM